MRRATTCALVASLVALSFLAYGGTLNYFFTGTDTFALIDSGRLASPGDLGRILTRPLMTDTTFVRRAAFYRPTATLSYGLDYSIWGLNPWGYHLTNIAAHALVCILVFFFVRLATHGSQATAWLSALIFTTHPVLIVNVPAISRRHDVMAAGLLLFSLLFFCRSRGRKFSGWSLVFYLLALGAKEIAIILPLVILGHHLLLARPRVANRPKKLAVLRAAYVVAPYLVVTVLYLAWRVYVLGGLGGYERVGPSSAAAVTPAVLVRILRAYLADLVDPRRLTAGPIRSFWAGLEGWSLTLGVVSTAWLLWYVRPLSRLIFRREAGIVRAARLALGAVLALSMAGIGAGLVLSVYSQLSGAPGAATVGGLLPAGIEGRRGGLLHFLAGGGNAVFTALCAGMLASAAALVGIERRKAMLGVLWGTEGGRLVAFLCWWLLLPLGVVLATRTFSHRTMYMAAIPFSGLLAMGILQSGRFLVVRAKAAERMVGSIGLGGTMALLAFLLSCSPAVRQYPAWQRSQENWASLLRGLSPIVARVPGDAVLHLSAVTAGAACGAGRTQVVDTGYVADYTVKSWLNLRHPGNQMEVVIHGRSDRWLCAPGVDVEGVLTRGKEVHVYIKLGAAGDAG